MSQGWKNVFRLQAKAGQFKRVSLAILLLEYVFLPRLIRVTGAAA
jgi:hypothetical protein